MDDKEISSIEFELLRESDVFEISSVQDIDLMKIRCFATHEGLNENGTIFTREMLLECYPTFVDKPLVLVQDEYGQPTGHAFDFKRLTFNKDAREHVGHIVNAFPCIVNHEGNIYDVSNLDPEEFPDGEFRIICDLVLYKYYLKEVSEIILDLHMNGMLNFSMEGLMDCNIDNAGIRHCTRIQFTGLAIVKRPAFKNAFSLEVAEQKEGGLKLDFEKMYNDLKSEHEVLIAEHATTVAELANKESELTAKDVEIAEKVEVLATKEIEIAEVTKIVDELKPFKEQVELAEKTLLGEQRLARLTKLGYAEKDIVELSSMDQVEYAALLEEVIDKASQDRKTHEQASTGSFIGTINTDVGFRSGKERLSELMAELCK